MLDEPEDEPIPPADHASQSAARVAAQSFRTIAATVSAHAEELGRIDAVAGDGDHGIGMQRGSSAAADVAEAAAARAAGCGTLIALAGDAWADRAGGTSGALWGLGLRAFGQRIGDQAAPGAEDVAAAVAAARQAITTTGGASVGDKTMVDALSPFDETLTAQVRSGASLADAWRSAAAAAGRAAENTKTLLPRTGRARPHAERSLGTPDAGAVSLALIVTAVADLLAGDEVAAPHTSSTKVSAS